jgi:hypothetical protein
MCGKKAMKHKSLYAFLLTCTVLSLSQMAQSEVLTQQNYDAQIQHYLDVIKATKPILDDPKSTADASAKSEAFCQRIDAYQRIVKLSEDNSQLDMASIMHMAAKNFLDRQQQSLTKSGMTTGAMCKTTPAKPEK